MKRNIALALCAVCGFAAFADEQLAYWLYDSSKGTVTDNVWTFKASVDSKTKAITFSTCWGYPEKLSKLDLSKPIQDSSSTAYTLTTLGNLFGNYGNYGKTVYDTTNGMTLAELVLPPKGLTTIGTACFAQLPALTNIVNFLPDSVTSLAGTAFYRVQAKQDLRLWGVTSVPRMTFQNSLITSVTFGPDVSYIGPGSNGQGSFASCVNITNYTFCPYGSGAVLTKSTLSLKKDTMQTFDLWGVTTLATGGVFGNLLFKKVIFDEVMDDMGPNETFSSCNDFNEVFFRGRPPAKLNLCYRSYNTKISGVWYCYSSNILTPTYVRRIYKDDWAPYAENGEISETGTTFSEELCTDNGVTMANRPLLLVPTVKIATAADFVAKLADDPWGEYELTADIDLADANYTTIPSFFGCLDGAGHKITGLGAQPLFGELVGTVGDLTIDGEVSGAVTKFTFGSNAIVGIFCRTNNSGTIVRSTVKNYNLACSGVIPGTKVGLFAGMAINDATFIGCTTDATGTWKAGNSKGGGEAYGGGIVGLVMTTGIPGRAANLVACTNNATGGFNCECYSGGSAGGIVGNVTSVAYPCTIRGCVNNGTISSDKKNSVMGGIMGAGGASADGLMLIVDCVNNGTITASASNGGFWLGGIFGTSGSCLVLSNCVNRGAISCSNGSSYGAGLGNNPSTEIGKSVVQRYYNCANYADITAVTKAGGFNAYSKCNKDYGGTGIYYSNCANYGAVTATTTDEFVPAGDEAKATMYYARSNRKVDNAFAMTRNIEYFKDEHPSDKWWFTVTNVKTAADDGYKAGPAVTALNAVAETQGLAEWCKGIVNGRVVPELKQFCLNPFKPGLIMLVR